MKKKIFITVLLCLFSISPISLRANELERNTVESDHEIVIENVDELSDAEIDRIMKKETEKYLERVVPGYADEKKVRARPTYETVYGTAKTVTIGGYAGNQPAGGRRFNTGGGFWFSDSGGPTASLNVSFPAPYDLISVSVTLGSVGSSGVFVLAPDSTHYFKLYVSKKVRVQPYVVYYTNSQGKKTVWLRSKTTTVTKVDQYAKQV